MNKYNDGRLLEWMKAMIGAGWQFYMFADPNYLFRHADEPVYLSAKESDDLFRLYVDIGTIFDPYEIQAWKDVGWNPEEKQK